MTYWTAVPAARRRRALFPEAIAAHAVELLDDLGYDGFSLRRLADRLEVAPASLYSRVRGPSDVLDLALDHALDADETIAAAVTSGAALDILRALHRHLLDHPWAVRVIAAAPPRGPAYLALSEALVVRLGEGGRTNPLTVAYAATNVVIGSALTTHAAGREPGELIDEDHAPTYAALHADLSVTPEEVLDEALRAVLGAA